MGGASFAPGHSRVRGAALGMTKPASVGCEKIVWWGGVPEGASGGVVAGAAGRAESRRTRDIGLQIADNLHPVANPAVDRTATFM